MDAELSVAQQEALLGWLSDGEDEAQDGAPRTTPPRCAAGSPVCSTGCPRRSSSHLEALMALETGSWRRASRAVAEVDRVGEHERMELEESLRRLARSLHGGPTHKRQGVRARADRLRPHHAPQHALRRHPVPPVTVGARRTSRGW